MEILFVGSIIQWNYKKLRVKHEHVRLLMNKIQPTSYNIGRKYEFYAIIQPDQRSKRGIAITSALAATLWFLVVIYIARSFAKSYPSTPFLSSPKILLMATRKRVTLSTPTG